MASTAQFFPNAKGLILQNVSMENVQGDCYLSGVDPDVIELNSMVYASNAGYNATKQCLPDTRKNVLDGIEDWALGKNPDTSRVLWLNGAAGTGKSSIAHTMALRLDRKKRLGSFFALDNSYQSERRQEKVFSTIARDLSTRNIAFKKALADILREKNWLRSTDIIQQWENLVVKPAAHLANEGPIVVFIDGLDESGDSQSRSHLLSVLAGRSEELPSNIRILLTSRPLDDIAEALGDSPYVLCKYMNEISKSDADHDIFVYISTQLARLGHSFFDSSRLRLLVERSEGLFQWAFIACEFIKGNGKISNPKKQFNVLMDTTDPGSLKKLDVLYDTVLRSIIDEDSIELFCSVMGQILGVFEPLSINALAALRGYFPLSDLVNDGDDIILVLRHMGSLMSGTSNYSDPIRPLHSSFLDYLTDQARSKDFYIDKLVHSNDLAASTLEVMKAELRFNICRLDTSYLLNAEVPDLAERTDKHISPALYYACRYWARHVHSTRFETSMADGVRYFLNNQFPYWIEILSLLKLVGIAASALSFIIKWINSDTEANDILDFSMDALQFVRMFGSVISQSAPHLYLSAIPFAPTASIIHRKYADKFPGSVRIVAGHTSDWPTCQNVLSGHTASVNCIVLSPDGEHIASGSGDKTIRVWDVETGEVVLGPLEGHTAQVNSVSYSPDGAYITSASNDCSICVWDARTGKLAAQPFCGHTGRVMCAVFSMDGMRIISGSSDKTIRIWDVKTGKEVAEPLMEHTLTVSSIAVSPDGRHFVSGSYDHTVRLWDVETRKEVARPFEGHTDWCTAVTFSLDGKRVISGSCDKTLRIWDVETGQIIASPLKGHSAPITSIALSPDGKCIISGSYDQTIYMWDAETGQTVSEPFLGHTNWVHSVAFSKDGKHIVSGAHDSAIRIWNAEAGMTMGPKPLEKHTSWVESVAISPDGRKIISGANDMHKPICIWDTETGQATGELFNGHTNHVFSVSYSPGGKYIVSGSADKTIRVWNTKTGEAVLGPLVGHTEFVLAVTFSYDGKYIFSGAFDKTVRFWDAKTGEAIGVPLAHAAPVLCIASSPNSHHVVSGLHDNTVHIWDWDPETGNAVSRPLHGHSDCLTSVAFAPGGKHIISSSFDRTIRVWDVEMGETLVVISACEPRHMDWVLCAAFSPDGEFVVSGSEDRTIRIWDAQTGKAVAEPFEGHTAPVTSVVYSPDGQSIISGSGDGTVRTWEFKAGELQGENNTSSYSQLSSRLKFSKNASHALENADLLFEGLKTTTGDWKDHIMVQMDGWILGPGGRRLIWVPHTNRLGLVTSRTKQIMGAHATELNLSHFAHGPLWDKCVKEKYV